MRPMTHSSVHTSRALFLPSTNIPCSLFFHAVTWSVNALLLQWKSIGVARISLVEILAFSRFNECRLPATVFRHRFRFRGVDAIRTDVLTGRVLLSSVFGLENPPLGEFFIKICLPRGKKSYFGCAMPVKYATLRSNVLRMHRDFLLGNFFPPATRGVFPVNSSEVLRRFVNSCGNIANASNGGRGEGREMRKRKGRVGNEDGVSL